LPLRASFYVKAIWDPDAGVFYSETEVPGLTVEVPSPAEFQQLVLDLAPEVLTCNAGTARFRGDDTVLGGTGARARRGLMVRDLYPEIARILRDHGQRRSPGGKGSHEKWGRDDGRILIIPRTQSRHTAKAVMKQAGLPKAF
jgi:predicted RNA binding protein YcfA (HicA-like mRNA interferase family)